MRLLTTTAATAAAVLLASSPSGLAQQDDKVHISSKTTSFKIAIFTDLHYGEGESDMTWGPVADANSTRVMSNMIAYESPSLAVYLGDLITGNNIDANATSYWESALLASDSSSVPHCAVFGNHDDSALDAEDGTPPVSARTPRPALLQFDSSRPLSYSRSDFAAASGGLSNYYILASDSSARPIAALYFLDSGGGTALADLQADLLEWLASAGEQAKEAGFGPGLVPQLLFLHIPSLDYATAFAGGQECAGHIFDDGVTPTGGLTLASTLAAMGVTHTFAGHDHGSDWCCSLEGLHYCFARHTGYGGYGEWERGARIVDIDADGNVKTWVRLEDGSVLARL